jgi:rubrerythrin
MVADELRDSILDLVKILDKGIAMEHHAQVFYKNAATKTTSPQGKKTYEWLVDFETNHEEKLRDKRAELLAHPSMKGVKPPPFDQRMFLSEAAAKTTLAPNATDVDVLRIALDNEERAYAFFTRKLKHSQEGHIKKMFETMAAEEEKHIKILTEIRRRLQIEGIWAGYDEID